MGWNGGGGRGGRREAGRGPEAVPQHVNTVQFLVQNLKLKHFNPNSGF